MTHGSGLSWSGVEMKLAETESGLAMHIQGPFDERNVVLQDLTPLVRVGKSYRGEVTRCFGGMAIALNHSRGGAGTTAALDSTAIGNSPRC